MGTGAAGAISAAPAAQALRCFALAAALTGVLATEADAHQPQIVGSDTRVRVTDPETSRAFYARLPGRPARYVIYSASAFTFFAQTTVPDVHGARRDFRMRIAGPQGQLADITTPPGKWEKFYEPFGGNNYLTGRKFRRRVPGGRYTIDVSNPGNTGVYVLAIGDAEHWDPIAAAHALAVIPEIKHDYFGESQARAWLSRTIPALLIVIGVPAGVALLVRRRVRRKRT